MAFTTTVTKTAATNLDFNYSNTISISSSAKFSIDETIPTGTSNNVVNFSFSTGSGVLLAMATDLLAYPLIVRTNSTSSPSNIFNITNSNQVIFDSLSVAFDSSGTLLTNINQLFVSNTGNLPASFRVDALFDNTPGI
jgi:hypothetical protein